MRIGAFLILSYLFTYTTLHGQTFVDIGEEQGLLVDSHDSFFGAGVSFFDFDHDGWDDLTFGQENDSVLFFKNVNGTFEQVVFNIEAQNACKSVLWVDFDNDGDSDFMTSNQEYGNRLYRNNGDMTFEDISLWCGLFQDPLGFHQSWAANWGDYDNDGLLDVYIVNNHDPVNDFIVKNYLYKNMGNGLFTDVTEEVGLFLGNDESFQGAFIDYNLDGHLDLYLINDKITTPNRMYENNGDGTFTDVTEECGAGVYIDAMSNTYGDVDLDGDQDLYLTNTDAGNMLLFHDGVDYYEDVTGLYNISVNLGCFAANFVDFDNDMYEDLYVSTTTELGSPFNPQNFAMKNMSGEIFFVDNDLFPNNDHVEYTNAMGDFNNDGRADIVGFTHNEDEYSRLWQNTTQNQYRYLKVSLEGVVTNRDGISCWIKVFSGGVQQTRYTFLGEDYLCQDSQREIFGMGTNISVDSLIVEWQSGHVDKFYNLPVNNTYHIVEGSSLTPDVEFANFCMGESTEIIASGDYVDFEWSTGDEGSVLTVSEPGYYTVVGYTELGVPSNEVEVYVEASPQPNISETVSNVSCYGANDGIIELENLLETELTSVEWSNDSTGVSLNSLAPGVYGYDALDANNCGVSGEVEIVQPDSIVTESTLQNVTCAGLCNGNLEVDISGGNGGFEILGETENLCAGHYTVTVVDSLGCESDVDFFIDEPEQLNGTVIITNYTEENAGSALIEIEGGTEPYDIEWSNGSDEMEVEGLELDSYWVEVTDANDCAFYEEFEIVLGVDELTTKDLLLFPNPASDFIQTAYRLPKGTEFRIYNTDMKLVQKGKLVNQKIDISSMSAGNYFLEFKDLSAPLLKFTKI